MQCEILMRQVRQDLMLDGRGDMASRVMSYRSGYSAQARRMVAIRTLQKADQGSCAGSPQD